jgi:PPP family 3-phenylpropionic acid transporter
MKHYFQWSAAFVAYFAILGLWTSFGPSTMMAINPQAAPIALACITLAYFVATPLTHRIWHWLGFSRALRAMSGGVLVLLLAAAWQPAWLVWCVPLAFICGSGSYTLCETRLLEDLAQRGQGHAFGRARKWGSLGFLLAATAGGAVFSVGGVAASFTGALAVGAVVYWLFCLRLSRSLAAVPEGPHTVPAPDSELPDDTPAQVSMSVTSLRGARWGGCAAIACMRVAEAASTTWFGAYWLHTGHSPLETGVLCAVPVGAEFLAMWKGGPWLRRHSAATVMLICCAASAVRWMGTPFCDALWCAVPLQSIHAFTFGFFYPASLVWLKLSFGDDFFHTRYLTESVARAATAAVTFAAAGWAIASLGYIAIYATCLLLTLVSGLWWLRAVKTTPAGQGA